MGGDAIALAELGLRAPPSRNCRHRLKNWRYWLAFLLKPSVYGVGGGDDVGEGAGLRVGLCAGEGRGGGAGFGGAEDGGEGVGED